MRITAVILLVLALAVPAAQASEPPKVLLTGDSMMSVIETAVADRMRSAGADVATDSRVGSGITKPFVLDWVAAAPAQARLFAPTATVVFLGAGDIYPLVRRGHRVRCCGRAWVAAWAERAHKMIRAWRDRTARAPGRVYWLTLPTPRDRGLARVHAAVNRAIRRAVRRAGSRAAVVDLVPLITPGRRYRRTVVWNGTRIAVRERDGVHLSPQGAEVAAAAIEAALARDGALTGAAPAGTTGS